MGENELPSRLPQFLLGSEIYSLVVTDMKGKIIFVNPLYQQRSSLPPASILGNAFSLNIHSDDRDAFDKVLYQCANNPEATSNVLLRGLNTSGNTEFYWTQWEFSFFKDQNGDPFGVLGVGHDVTQHKAAEETTYLHRLVLDQIRDFVTFTDLDGVITYVNRAEVEAAGRPKEEIIGKPISVFGEDPDLAISQQEILKQSLQKGGWRGEVVNVAANGNKIFLDCRTQLIYNEQGKPIAICGISTDITEQKEKEMQLKLSEYKLKAILNSTTDGNIFLSPAYTIQSINQAAQRYVEMVFGRSVKENDSILEFILPETKEVFLEDTFKALNGEIVRREFPVNGFWFEITHFPVYDEQNNLIGFSMNSTNIDERRKAEEYRKALLESIPDLYFVLDLNGVFLDYKAERKDLLVQEDVFLNKSIHEILPAELAKNLAMAISETLDKRITTEINYALEMDGGERFYQARINSLGADRVIVLSRDISELQKQQNLILKRNETLRNIAWQQSHTLRGPLMRMQLLCDVMKNFKEETAEHKMEYIDYLLQSIEELDGIIHDIVRQTNLNEQ